MHSVPGLFDKLSGLYADGERAIQEGRFADAVARFSEGIGLDDHFRQRYVTMYAQRAFAYQRLGDHMRAIPDYTRAIEMEPDINKAQYHFHRGMCFAAIGGHLEHAVADYGRSIALHDGHPGPFHLRGKILTTEFGRHEEAIADFDRFLAMRPHPEVFQLRGHAKLLLGRGADAIPDLVESARLAPDVYTDYLLAWAGAIAPDDELFYRSMEAVLRADPSYRPYFVDNDDYRRFYGQARFNAIVGPG
ncbi:MAG: tetratricopeptide repeat protein [Kofleriaceae bacterium]|nr:tetratricopeptide repeat protein [Kofleriaceae bacterium]MCB9573488.1 tetratricopeptide repeat protein [Kofleriaceae bacterium]